MDQRANPIKNVLLSATCALALGVAFAFVIGTVFFRGVQQLPPLTVIVLGLAVLVHLSSVLVKRSRKGPANLRLLGFSIALAAAAVLLIGVEGPIAAGACEGFTCGFGAGGAMLARYLPAIGSVVFVVIELTGLLDDMTYTA